MKNRTFLININTLKYIIVFFVWIPAYALYNYIPMANKIMLFLRLLCSIIIIIKNFSFNWKLEYILIGAYSVIEIVSTLLYNQENLFNVLEFCLCIMSMCVFFVNLNNYKQLQFRKAVAFWGIIYAIGITFTCFITPSSMREDLGLHFFVSSRANSAQTMICILVLMFALDFKFYGKPKLISLLVLIFTGVSMIGLHSGQGIIMLGIVIIVLVIFTRKKADKLLYLISPIGVAVINIFLNWLIISQAYLNVSPITYFITNILKKDVTLTGRDIIYTNIVSIFLKNPLLGFGYENSIVKNSLSHFAEGYNSAHNSPFQILIEVGIVGFAIFFVLVFLVLARLEKAKTTECYIVYGGIVAFLIGGITSLAYYNIYFYVLMAFCVGMYCNNKGSFRKDTRE